MSGMSHEAIVEFLARPLLADFVTLRSDGSPHAAPVWYEFLNGRFLIFTQSRFQRVRNLERNPHGVICIACHDKPYAYVSAEGSVRMDRDPSLEIVRSVGKRYDAESATERYIQETPRATRILLTLTPERLITWQSD